MWESSPAEFRQAPSVTIRRPMLDPRLLREDPQLIRESLRRRGSKLDLEPLVELDREYRQTLQEAEELRARQKEAGREIAALEGESKEKAIAEVADLAVEVKRAATEAEELAEQFRVAWLEMPNLVAEDAADGYTEDDYLEVRRVGDASTVGTDHAT